MKIIPVIDIMGGSVVQAIAGNRLEYQTIQSTLTNAHKPLAVIADLIRYYPFTCIYIADLDAINGQRPNLTYIDDLNQFSGVRFWLDLGFSTQVDLREMSRLINISPVLATETLQTVEQISPDHLLSLDFKDGMLLGDQDWLQNSELWPQQLIVMDLNSVGGMRGPNLPLLNKIRRCKPSASLITAGGIRGEHDIFQLTQLGVEGGLVASALHRGLITPDIINRYSLPENR